jgi:cyclopropane fatty-acyl-phospholipid synthase-like methyltransferase
VAQVVVGELLARSLHVHAGERVLDVAGGAGNTALAAAWERVRFSARMPSMAFKRS